MFVSYAVPVRSPPLGHGRQHTMYKTPTMTVYWHPSVQPLQYTTTSLIITAQNVTGCEKRNHPIFQLQE